MWAVMLLKKDLDVVVLGAETVVDLSFADGMIGAIPVFDTEEKAIEFAGGRYHIIEMSIKE